MEPQDTHDELAHEIAPETPPKGPWVWARENLFSTPFNSVLTIVGVIIVVFFVRGMLAWLFDPERRWDAVLTNMRFYMTQAYHQSGQFVRVWVGFGAVVALAGLSFGAWRIGGRITVHSLTRGAQAAAGGLFVAAMLGPADVDVDTGIPIIDAVVEMVALTGGRLWAAIAAVVVFAVAALVARSYGPRAKEAEVPILAVPLVAIVATLVALWVIPFGRYVFRDGQNLYESGTVSTSTTTPLTIMAVLLVVSYYAGRALVDWVGQRVPKAVLSILWVLALPIIVLVVLRDPAFDFGHLARVDLIIWAVFVIGGGLIITVLSNPNLGEPGRAVSGLLLVVALGMWAVPMLIRIRLFGLLLALFAIGAPTFAGDRQGRMRYIGLWIGIVTVLGYLFAVVNTPSTLEIQAKSFLGGLTLTFVLALTSIFLSFPLGLLMALGRTSSMPIFRVISTAYIELVRGIPFITVLFFFDIILVLFLPEGLEPDSVTLAIIAGTLFSAAYLAENVRGGLQAIQTGQYEAARAMGLSTLQLTVFIVLPQALRAVIPALVGQTIAIFKDTSLVAIIGLFDFLFIADKVIPAQTIFLGIRLENLVFIAAVYWLFTFSFSRASLRIERKVGLGER